MLSDVRNYYGLTKDFGQAGYFETEHSDQIIRKLKLEIKTGKLLALSGVIGSGKSTILRRIQDAVARPASKRCLRGARYGFLAKS